MLRTRKVEFFVPNTDARYIPVYGGILQQLIECYLIEGAKAAEIGVRRFMERTHLRASEVQLVLFHGKYFPQWKWAAGLFF